MKYLPGNVMDHIIFALIIEDGLNGNGHDGRRTGWVIVPRVW